MITIASAEFRTGVLARAHLPWEANPYRIVSLLDMLQFYAHSFIASMQQLKRLIEPNLSTWEGVRVDPTESLKDNDIRIVQEILQGLMEELDNIGVKSLKLFAENLSAGVSLHSDTYLSIKKRLGDLDGMIKRELADTLFMHVPTQDKFYFNENPFGDEIGQRLPKRLRRELSGAAKCIGAGEYTAGVFHLMRLMESMVKRLAGKLKGTVTIFPSGEVHLGISTIWDGISKGISE